MTLPSEWAVCPRCKHTVTPVAVAGHTQCPNCNQVIDECCSGESVSIRSEAEPLLAYHVICRGCDRQNTGYGTRPANCAFCGVELAWIR